MGGVSSLPGPNFLRARNGKEGFSLVVERGSNEFRWIVEENENKTRVYTTREPYFPR